jgi:hypothetical protein
MNTFETGATTAAANNLVLSVMNDGAVYKDRKHIIFAALQGSTHLGIAMRDIVQREAEKQRKGGAKFPAASISEAAKIVYAQTLTHCLEIIREDWTGENFRVRGLKWWDATNGNTYHSTRILIPSKTYASGRYINTPMEYGYGDQWQHTAIDALRNIGFVLPKNVPWYTLPVTFEGDAPYTRKRNLFEGIFIPNQGE